jgi:hypothetical protein
MLKIDLHLQGLNTLTVCVPDELVKLHEQGWGFYGNGDITNEQIAFVDQQIAELQQQIILQADPTLDDLCFEDFDCELTQQLIQLVSK